jgi:hypothetical protein
MVSLMDCASGRFAAGGHCFSRPSIDSASEVQLKQCLPKLNRGSCNEIYEISPGVDLICTSTLESGVIFIAKGKDNWVTRLDMTTCDTHTKVLADNRDMLRISCHGDKLFIAYSEDIHCLNWSDMSQRVISDNYDSTVCCIGDDRIVTEKQVGGAHVLVVLDVNTLTEHATYTSYEDTPYVRYTPDLTADDSRICVLFDFGFGIFAPITVFDHNLNVLRSINTDQHFVGLAIVGDYVIAKAYSLETGDHCHSYSLETGDHMAEHGMTRPTDESSLNGIASTTTGKLLLVWSNGTIVARGLP